MTVRDPTRKHTIAVIDAVEHFPMAFRPGTVMKSHKIGKLKLPLGIRRYSKCVLISSALQYNYALS